MSYLADILIGFLIAAIPGAIFIEVSRRTLTVGLAEGILVCIGEFIGHVVLFLLIFIGLSRLLLSSTATAIFYLLGGLVMVWLAIQAFRKETKTKIRSGNSFLVGFVISVSDPFIIGLWVSLSGSLLHGLDYGSAFMKIFLVSFGFLLFFISLAIILSLTSKKIPEKVILWFSRICAIGLIITAGYYFYKLGILFS